MRYVGQNLRLEPSEKNLSTARADIVFVHGLAGDRIATWQRDPNNTATYWPDWIVEDSPYLAVWNFGYDAQRFGGSEARAMPLEQRALSAIDFLASGELGLRPIVFVAHSLGGLLVKQLLRAALEGPDLWKRFARAVTGIVFIATPHAGSRLADAASAQRNLLGASTATVDLVANSPKLLELREWFAEYANSSGLLAVSYMETRKDPILQRIIVSAESSWAGVGRTIAIDEDHINIARPLSRTQPPYPAIMAKLREWLPEVGGKNISLDVDLSSAGDGRAQILGPTSYSLRYRNIVGEAVRLGLDRKLYPPPTVPRIARLLGHDSDGVLVDQLRRKRSVAFSDGGNCQ
jgi:pimeloyl-ACP methyl ester carboxylesterase